MDIRDGYETRRVWLTGNTIFFDRPERQIHVYVGRDHIGGSDLLDGETGSLPIAIVGLHIAGYAYTVELMCERSDDLSSKWQHETYLAIMGAYEQQRVAYEERLERLTPAPGSADAFSDPRTNRAVIERELRREAVSLVTGQHFDAFDAMRRTVAPHGFPQLDLAEAEAEAAYIQFFEEALDWRNMMYRFYPYQWARKDSWPTLATLEDPDPLMAAFLRSGAARVRLPVAPGFDEAVIHYFETGGNLPDGDDVPHLVDDFHLALLADLASARGEDALPGPGELNVENGSTAVVGVGTSFTEDDEGRELIVGGDRYLVVRVEGPGSVQIDRGFEGGTANGVPCSVGIKLIGSPWQVRIPTRLVTLREDTV